MPATTKRPAAKRATAKRSAAKSAPKSAGKAAGGSAGKQAAYTDPALRERLKKRITAGSKGGKPGQWSARKAQLLAHEYEAAGGGYTGRRDARQRHLSEWTAEAWTTADGRKAARPGGTARYLPKEAWSKLSPAEQRATDEKKRAGGRAGAQFVANTGAARQARKAATKDTATKGGAATRAAAKQPAAKRPAAKRPAAKRPAAKRPAAKRPAAKRPSAKRLAAKRPAAKRAARSRQAR